jgi:hypothetical protein
MVKIGKKNQHQPFLLFKRQKYDLNKGCSEEQLHPMVGISFL